MKFQIRSVILWSRDPSLEPRKLLFESGMVNVLTGNARTGKSALIPIIDYCLCSSSCAIPKKAVRSACEWFGIIVETQEGEKLFARKNPGDQDAVEDMYVIEGVRVDVPRRIPESNTEARYVKRDLDKLSGLSHLDFAGGDSSIYGASRLGFRDLMAFVFQPQNVVANRDILFYRTEELEYKNRLARNTLPYVLGAVTAETLAAQYELERLNRELRRKQRDLERAKKASSRWEAEMAGHLTKAEELGLVQEAHSSDTSPDAILSLLREVAKKTVDDFKADSTTITGAVERLMELEAEDDRQAKELAELKARQEELSRLREGAGGYRDALLLQKDRLSVSSWLAEHSAENPTCPICGNNIESHRKELAELQSQLVQIETSAGQLSEMPAAVDREVQHLRRAIDELAEKLGDIRRQKRTLTAGSQEAQKRQFQSLSVAHFLGQLSQALSLYAEVQEDGELPNEIEELKRHVSALSAQVNVAEIKHRKDAALDRMSHYISRFMPQLDNDHGNDAARLVVEDLTLRISGTQGESFLWSIGSGSNHLSYHVATLLALHCFFLDERATSVPGLLVLDQPSQVYFPEKIHRGKTAAEQPWTNDEDVAAVRKVFEVLGKVVGSVNERLQVIVLDHAPDSVWGNLPEVTLVEDWHTGKKLVPSNWPGVGD